MIEYMLFGVSAGLAVVVVEDLWRKLYVLYQKRETKV